MKDTIVANATAHGIGSINIVRLSGKDALKIAQKLVKKDFKPRYATLSEVCALDGTFIDEAIIIFFQAPRSFTGEDVVEFQIHGGFILAQILIDELIKCGARYAQAGEFSKRAFLNNKMDLSKAQAIANLINAKSLSAAKILARQLKGELSTYVNSLRQELVKTLAFVEVCIDYAEEDLPSDVLEAAYKLLEENIKKLKLIVELSEQRKGLIDGFKIAIIGKPNVGKSSILNSLLKYDRAIISDIAGTTRDSIEENLQIGTHLVKIIDTAGIRQSAEIIESLGIELSLKAANQADIILAVFDSSSAFDEQDEKILELCQESDKKIFYILNKVDLPRKFTKNFENEILLSAKENTEEIIKVLGEYLNSQDTNELMLSSYSQIEFCKKAKNFLEEARENLSQGELEIFALYINKAIEELAKITRNYERDEILDEMFSSFCLGK